MASSYMSDFEKLQRNKRVFQAIYQDFMDINPIDFLLGVLYSREIISQDRMLKIKAKNTPSQRNAKLWSKMMRTKNVGALDAVRDGIRDQYPYIAEKMKPQARIQQFKEDVSKLDKEELLEVAKMIEDMRCSDRGEHSAAAAQCGSSGDMDHDSLHPDTSAVTGAHDDDILEFEEEKRVQPKKRTLRSFERDSDETPTQVKKLRVDKEVTKKTCKSRYAPKKEDENKPSGFNIQRLGNPFVWLSTLSTPKREQPANQHCLPDYESQRREIDIRNRALNNLRDAERGTEVETLREALQVCETDETLCKNREVRKAADILKAIDASRDELQRACQKNDVKEIKRLVKKISQSKEAKFLQQDLGNANKQLESPPSRVSGVDVTKLDFKSATGEIKQYRLPSSPIMEKVMFACLLLLGEEEKNISSWTAMQKSFKGLDQRIAKFKPNRVYSLAEKKVRDILGGMNDQEVQSTSSAIYLFYAWTRSRLDELQAANTFHEVSWKNKYTQ